MLPKSRLVAAAAAAGTVCAVAAAGTAMAAPTPLWSKHNPAVPNAYTNTTPALSAIDVNGLQGTFLAWKGQYNNRVKYKININGKWHADGVIPGAATNTSPSAALFATNKGREAVFVAWKSIGGGGLSTIKYSDGVVNNNGSIKWTWPVIMPGGLYSETSASPAVLFPVNSKLAQVIVSYRGPLNHVRVEIGTESGPNGRKFTWGTKTVKSAAIGTGTAFTTGAQPALTEILGAGGNGTIYVFWKGLTVTASISYASTPDLASTGLDGVATLTWTPLGPVPDSGDVGDLAQTTGSPAVASATKDGNGPLLLAYKGPSGFSIRFQTFDGTTWSQPHLFVNGSNNTTALGPALVHGTLANVSRTDGRIFLHHYLG